MEHEAHPTPLEKAIGIAGSQARLGELCGVSQNAIWAAKRAGRVSAELAMSIEKATDGQVPRWEMRPDLWDRPSSTEAA